MQFNLNNYIKVKKEVIDKELLNIISSSDNNYGDLQRSMLYSINAGGKRLRPILCLASCEALGSDSAKAIPVACGIEMIHTYSLIHDDLPSMDDDSLRRGKPTNHNVFGEATAILTGDALLADAFYIISKSILDNRISSMTGIELINDVSYAAGSRGMVGGQVLDLYLEGSDTIDIKKVEEMHLLKTGALITCSVMAGARIGGANTNELESFKKFAQCIGLAYQIMDDLLDIEGNDDLGKEIGVDKKKKKVTYPSIAGHEESKRKIEELTNYALSEITRFNNSALPLKLISKYLVERKN
jgi:geranylgeranyl diphosphate synthase type II